MRAQNLLPMRHALLMCAQGGVAQRQDSLSCACSPAKHFTVHYRQLL